MILNEAVVAYFKSLAQNRFRGNEE